MSQKKKMANSVKLAGFNRVEVELTMYRRTRGNGSPVLEIRLTTRYLFAAVVATSQINLSPLTDTKKAIKQQKTTNNQHKKHKTTLTSTMTDDGYDTSLIDLAIAARNSSKSPVAHMDEAAPLRIWMRLLRWCRAMSNQPLQQTVYQSMSLSD